MPVVILQSDVIISDINVEINTLLRNIYRDSSETERYNIATMKNYALLQSNYFRSIHSFIMEIYIAPLQGYYSEALPTLARLKRRVNRLGTKLPEHSNLWATI